MLGKYAGREAKSLDSSPASDDGSVDQWSDSEYIWGVELLAAIPISWKLGVRGEKDSVMTLRF